MRDSGRGEQQARRRFRALDGDELRTRGQACDKGAHRACGSNLTDFAAQVIDRVKVAFAAKSQTFRMRAGRQAREETDAPSGSDLADRVPAKVPGIEISTRVKRQTVRVRAGRQVCEGTHHPGGRDFIDAIIAVGCVEVAAPVAEVPFEKRAIEALLEHVAASPRLARSPC